MKDFIHLKRMFEILCVIPCPVKLDGYLCVLDEKNNDLDAMLHFKRTLNNVNKSERPADALAVKKYQSLSDNLKSRDASASKKYERE